MIQDIMIIDAHVHTYPSKKIGQQALGSYGYGCSGTIDNLEEVMQKANISHAVMANFLPIQEMKKAGISKFSNHMSLEHKAAVTQEIENKMLARLERKNRWTCESARENARLSALISVDILQRPEEMIKELEQKILTLGAKGIKLHPIANECSPADKRLWPAYMKAQDLGVPVLFHAGVNELPNYNRRYEGVMQFEDVAKSFPSLTIVLAHLGKGYYEDSVKVAAKYPNIFFDTSTCFAERNISNEDLKTKIVNIIKRIGAQRIMFGTDWPWFDPNYEIEIIKSLDLSNEEKLMIFSRNAKRIYKI